MKERNISFQSKIDTKKKQTYIVDDARLVSSCFNWPSNAKPRLSLFSDNNGFRL